MYGAVLAAVDWVLLAAPAGPGARAQEPLHTAVLVWIVTTAALWTLTIAGVLPLAVVTALRSMREAQEQAEQEPLEDLPGGASSGEHSAEEQGRERPGLARDLGLRATIMVGAAVPVSMFGWLLPSVMLDSRHPAPSFAAPGLTLVFAFAAFTHAALSVAVVASVVRPVRHSTQ
ncbi:hypothetical protein AB0L06_42565 [Spirillospora sp. NPDC052269]